MLFILSTRFLDQLAASPQITTSTNGHIQSIFAGLQSVSSFSHSPLVKYIFPDFRDWSLYHYSTASCIPPSMAATVVVASTGATQSLVLCPAKRITASIATAAPVERVHLGRRWFNHYTSPFGRSRSSPQYYRAGKDSLFFFFFFFFFISTPSSFLLLLIPLSHQLVS